MNKFSAVDRDVVSVLFRLESPTQEAIAKITGAKKSAITHSLLKLEKLNVVELQRKGQRHIPRLKVLGVLEQLEAAIGSLRCALDAGAGAA